VEKGRSSCLGSFHITNKSSRDMAKRNTNKHRVGLYRVSAEKKNWDPLQGLPSPAPQHCTPDWKNFKSTLEQRLLGKNGSKDISYTLYPKLRITNQCLKGAGSLFISVPTMC
jgi:hypothetical protein